MRKAEQLDSAPHGIHRPGAEACRKPSAQFGWTAILLAGERPGGDPLAAHFGVRSKALIPVAGMSMLLRVAEVLLSVPEVGRVIILAQDPEGLLVGDAAPLRRNCRISFEVSGPGIAASISAIAGSPKAPWPVLVTTADHALLTAAMVSEFLAAAHDCDVAVGFGERHTIEQRYPQTRRTWLKFSDGQFSGANLFALRNARVFPALRFWMKVEQDRKKSFRLIARFGIVLLLRACTRTIGLQEGLERAGMRLRMFAKSIVMSASEAAIDVDKLADHELAETILRARESCART